MKKNKKMSKQKMIITIVLGLLTVAGLSYYLSQTRIWEQLFASNGTVTNYTVIRLEDDGLEARVNDVSANRNGFAGYLFDNENSMQYATLWNQQGKIVSRLRAKDGGDMTYFKITDRMYRGFVEKKYGTYPNGIGYIHSVVDNSYPNSFFAITNGKITRFSSGVSDSKINENVIYAKSKITLEKLITAYPILKSYSERTQQALLKPFVTRNIVAESTKEVFEPMEVNNRNHILGIKFSPKVWKTSVWVDGNAKDILSSKILELSPKGHNYVLGLSISNTNIISGVVYNSDLRTPTDLGFTYQYSTDPTKPTKVNVWKPVFMTEPGSVSMVSNVNDEGKALMHEAFSFRNSFFSTISLIDTKDTSVKPINISRLIVNRTGKPVLLNGSVGLTNSGDILGVVVQGTQTEGYFLRYYIYNYMTNKLRFIDKMIGDGTIIGAKNWDYIEPWSISDNGSMGAFCLKGSIMNPESDLAGCIIVPKSQ